MTFDAIEHPRGYRLVSTHEHDEGAVPVQHRPEACPLAERRFTRAARHGEGKQLAGQDGTLDLVDCPQMVRRPRQREGLRTVGFRERSEVLTACLVTLWLGYWRYFANVPTGG